MLAWPRTLRPDAVGPRCRWGFTPSALPQRSLFLRKSRAFLLTSDHRVPWSRVRPTRRPRMAWRR